MRPERFVLTTKTGTASRKRIWDSSRPIGIGYPLRWVIERSEEGEVRVRNLAPGAHDMTDSAWVTIPEESLQNGKTVTVAGIELTLNKVQPPKAAFLSVVPKEQKQSSITVLAFTGVRHWITQCETLHEAFVGYQRGKPVLIASQTNDGLEIKPLLKNVFIKLKGQASVPIESGHPLKVTWDDLQGATILRGTHWWKFNVAQETGPVPVDGPSVHPEADHEKRLMRTTSLAMLATFAFILFSTWFAPKIETPIVPEKKPEPIVTFHSFKQAGARDAGSSPGQTPRPAQGDAGPTASSNASVPPPAFNNQQQAKAFQSLPKSFQQRIASENARRLQEALLSVKSLTQKPIVAVSNAIKSLKGGSTASVRETLSSMGATEAKPVFEGSKKEVSGIGGGGAATGKGRNGDGSGGGGSGSGGVGTSPGYGTGTRVGLNSAGSSMVSMASSKEMRVQEGLTREEVGAVIHQHLQEVRYCHETAMMANPSSEGKLVLEFTINSAGTVTAVSQSSSTFPDPQISFCITRRLKMWAFPKPKGGVNVTVSYPFLFRVLSKE